MANDNKNQNKCPNDCLRCSECQRLYCAATWSRKMHDRMDELDLRLDKIEKKIDELEHDDCGVFNPIAEAEPSYIEEKIV